VGNFCRPDCHFVTDFLRETIFILYQATLGWILVLTAPAAVSTASLAKADSGLIKKLKP
jgi:hypothetical protein